MSIQVLKKGVEFLIDTSDRLIKKPVHIVFCHKDVEGKFQNGVTSEDLLDMLISRHSMLADKDPSHENINTLLHLRQARDWMRTRNQLKMQKRKTNDHQGNGLSVPAGGEQS